MAVTIGWWTIDVMDAASLASFWEQLLGWRRIHEDPDDGIALAPPGPLRWGTGLLLYTDHTSGAKRGKNPAHLDLRPADQAAAVQRARSLGATRVDIGQGDDVSWEVLADPEGDEFCVLRADGSVPDGLDVAAWTLDAHDVEATAAFWRGLLGWDEVERDDHSVQLRDPAGEAHDLLVWHTSGRTPGKNRVHPDLIPSGTEDDPDARPRAVARALELGASRVDIGQGEVGWDVLADPDGNEFCILQPRGWTPAT